MNAVMVTGYLNGDAKIGYTPAQVRKAVFDLVVDIGGGAHVPWRCEIEDDTLIARSEPYLTSGRPVILKCELSGRPYEERGVQKSWTKFLRVVAAEFPQRSAPKKDEGKADDKSSAPAEAASA